MKRTISDLIGFQLVNKDKIAHPLMADNSSVYSLMQVQEMLIEGWRATKNYDGPYNIIRIYYSDIENPKVKFSGDPFTSDN